MIWTREVKFFDGMGITLLEPSYIPRFVEGLAVSLSKRGQATVLSKRGLAVVLEAVDE